MKLQAHIRGAHLDAAATDGARGDVHGGAAVVDVALGGVGGALDHGYGPEILQRCYPAPISQ